jgi:hypothetical protein
VNHATRDNENSYNSSTSPHHVHRTLVHRATGRRYNTAASRKCDLVTLGLWALHTGRGWVMLAARVALVQEGMTHA